MKLVDNFSSKQLIAVILASSTFPFLAVELFKSQLYTVVEISPYLVFHNVAEFFSVIVSFSIFGLGWYAYDQNRDQHSLFLSVAFFAIGLMDFMHTLSYAGMPPLITPNTPNKATQFWIAVRFFSASAFLSSVFVPSSTPSRRMSKAVLMTAALFISAIVFVSIIYFPEDIPTAFIQGVGLTQFKIISEYVIISLLILAAVMYWRRLSQTGERLTMYYLAAFVLCIFSELAFTLYNSAFDTYNMLGHMYKTAAFLLIYKGIFVASVRKPYEELFVSNEALRLNRNMLSHIMDSIPQSIFWKDRECVYLGCNKIFARQAGVDSPEDIVGKSDFDLPWGVEASEGYRADDRDVMARGEAKPHIVESLHTSEGAVIWIDTTKIPLVDSSGSVHGVLGVYEDITRRKQAEEALQEALQFNQQIITSAKEGIVVYDRDLRYRVWNPFMEQLTGLGSADVLGNTPREVFPFLKDAGVVERLAKVLEGETVDPLELPFQVAATGKSGWASDMCAPLLNAKGEIIGVIGTVRDISENRKTEEQLRQSQKMEALGQLAGGVAHDFNNMLQVVMGYSTLLSLDATAAQKEQIAEILAASERAADLTSGLLSYSRKQVFKIEPSDLGRLVAGVEKFLRRILGEDIALSLELPSETLTAAVDRAHIQQVFINLSSNARDAMPSGGKLSIGMERIEMDEEFVTTHGFGTVGSYALITVSDTGSGIPKEHRQKIFEPFFTTKGVGQGTGLGLSIVYGIITQHNGFINCYSEEGAGTTFHIYLPLSPEWLQPHETAVAIDTDEDKGKIVLIAEDDPAVRKITRDILQLHGYVVLEASNGREAVTIFRDHAHTIDLVVLDALMPELNGAEALSAIREIKPGAKALFMSGYGREIISGKMLIPDDAEFVGKPVLPARLMEAIRKLIRGEVVHATPTDDQI
ncbi:MAG: PAS domain-containing protein [Geobacteraceae bacterium]|nr:PAS domain-containing protein [Geobacteraceae bacterium]